MAAPYSALSLDLWFTILSFEPAALPIWQAERERTLRELLRMHDDTPPRAEQVSQAVRSLRDALAKEGTSADLVEPARYLELLADELGGRVLGDLQRAAFRYSDAGLSEAPPRVNPEVVRLVRELQAREVPVVITSNTARQGRSWQRFFTEQGGPSFQHVVTSCEVGVAKPHPEIFRQAARLLGLPPSSILHVGDRWDLDVEGARSAGLGPALYRGLWPRYPDPSDQEISRQLDDAREDVLRLDRMDELLRPGLLAPE